MTKKDYKLIAEAILHSFISWDDTMIVALEFAKMLEKDNPKFNREVFIKACLGE